jgi:hypothetical protein
MLFQEAEKVSTHNQAPAVDQNAELRGHGPPCVRQGCVIGTCFDAERLKLVYGAIVVLLEPEKANVLLRGVQR